MAFPKMFRVKQELEGPMLADIPGAVRDTIRGLRLHEKVKPGQTVAITSGSRGVANIARITRAAVDEMKTLGLKPFIVPAMGSHGEATAEGQLKILAHYGYKDRVGGKIEDPLEGVGFFGRPETILVLLIGGLTGFIWVSVIVIAVGTNLSALQRIIYLYGRLS